MQRVGLATSNLARGWGLPRPIIQSHAEERMGVPWAKEAAQNLGVPFNICTMAEATDFKFGTQLGFTKAHHKIPHRKKLDMVLYHRSFPKFWSSL